MGYSRRILNYLERIVLLSDSTHMISMANLVAINVVTPKIDTGCSLEKEFIKFICMNPRMILYLIVNQLHLCHDYVCDSLTLYTKYVLWIHDCVL